MDVVRTAVESLGGTIDLTSQVGQGTRLRLRLPLTLAIIPSLLVKAAGHRYAIPQVNLEELVRLYDDRRFDALECAGNRELYRLREINLPMVYLSEILRHPGPFGEALRSELCETRRLARDEFRQSGEGPESITFAVLRSGDLRFGLVVDAVLGSEEIVVKPLHKTLKSSGLYSGATVLGDGEVALILDAAGLARHTEVEADLTAQIDSDDQFEGDLDDPTQASHKESLLIFEWGSQERFALPLNQVRRVVEIDPTTLEHVGSDTFALVEGHSTAVLRIESRLKVSRPAQNARQFLILPHRNNPPCGILCTRLIDAGNFDVRNDGESHHSGLVEKSILVKDRLTLLLDAEAWVDVAPQASRIEMENIEERPSEAA
jgi:two-component system chemotaxis sensor kinase CheA